MPMTKLRIITSNMHTKKIRETVIYLSKRGMAINNIEDNQVIFKIYSLKNSHRDIHCTTSNNLKIYIRSYL